jgi:hypothetical protein
MTCGDHLELVSLVRLDSGTVHDRRRLTRLDSLAPSEPITGFTVLDRVPVAALGICSGEYPDGDQPASAAAIVRAWRLSSEAAPVPINLLELKPWNALALHGALPRLYQPIDREWTRQWASGRYGLEVAIGAETVWFGIEVGDARRDLR